MATARFTDKKTGYTSSIELFVWKKTLTERASTWRSGKTVKSSSTATDFKSQREIEAAYEKRCLEILGDDWHDALVGGRRRFSRRAPAPAADTEKSLDALSEELATSLVSAKGSRVKERAAIKRAVAAYGKIRAAIGEPPLEFATHFFSADGVGLTKARVPALQRPKPDPETFARWLSLLEESLRPRTPRARKTTSRPAR